MARIRKDGSEALLQIKRGPRLAFKLSDHFAFRLKRTPKDVYVDQWQKHPRGFQACENDMRATLAKKGIIGSQATDILRQGLDAAAKLQLFKGQWRQRKNNRAASIQARKNVIRQLGRLIDCLASLPDPATTKLNDVMLVHDTRDFDSETFAYLIEALADVLCELAPKCRSSRRAFEVIYKPVTPETPEINTDSPL